MSFALVVAALAPPAIVRADESQAAAPAWIVTTEQGIVASDHALASEAGAAVLRSGGNAIDAGWAVSLALSVCRPESTGVGGGGFTIVRMADGRVMVMDARETAPAAASPNMYVKAIAKNPDGPPPSLYGDLAAGVPGVLAGWRALHETIGTKPLHEIIAPAIRIAEGGYAIDAYFAKNAGEKLAVFEKYPSLKQSCGYVYETFLNGGRPLKAGDVIRQPALARLLRAIDQEGVDIFYKGEVADAIVRAMQRGGGIITKADLAAYRPKRREPLRATYRDYEIIAMPPPSSGGICVLQTLRILEHFDLAAMHRRDPAAATHVFVEAMKHAFADRARWLADPDFAPVPTNYLLSDKYIAELAGRIALDKTQPTDSYGSPQLPEDAGTSHFCIIDRWGNCVVSTETINTVLGSLAAVPAWGFILNNEMDDFAAEPGKPNAYGLIQSDRNAPEPGKRPLSSMSPTIVLRDGRPVLLIGASGGPRIITSTLNVMVNLLDYDELLQGAIVEPRVHHQWKPDEVYFDRPPPPELTAGLQRIGHTVSSKPKHGYVQAIVIDGAQRTAASDPQKGGRPAAE